MTTYRNVLSLINYRKHTINMYCEMNFCPYMDKWMNGASQEEYYKMQDEYQEFLDSEILL